MKKPTWKFKPGVIGTLTSSTTIAGSIKITENLADMFAAEGRLDLFELPEAMILKPISDQTEPAADLTEETEKEEEAKPNRKKRRNNNKNNDAPATTQ